MIKSINQHHTKHQHLLHRRHQHRRIIQQRVRRTRNTPRRLTRCQHNSRTTRMRLPTQVISRSRTSRSQVQSQSRTNRRTSMPTLMTPQRRLTQNTNLTNSTMIKRTHTLPNTLKPNSHLRRHRRLINSRQIRRNVNPLINVTATRRNQQRRPSIINRHNVKLHSLRQHHQRTMTMKRNSLLRNTPTTQQQRRTNQLTQRIKTHQLTMTRTRRRIIRIHILRLRRSLHQASITQFHRRSHRISSTMIIRITSSITYSQRNTKQNISPHKRIRTPTLRTHNRNRNLSRQTKLRRINRHAITTHIKTPKTSYIQIMQQPINRHRSLTHQSIRRSRHTTFNLITLSHLRRNTVNRRLSTPISQRHRQLTKSQLTRRFSILSSLTTAILSRTLNAKATNRPLIRNRLRAFLTTIISINRARCLHNRLPNQMMTTRLTLHVSTQSTRHRRLNHSIQHRITTRMRRLTNTTLNSTPNRILKIRTRNNHRLKRTLQVPHRLLQLHPSQLSQNQSHRQLTITITSRTTQSQSRTLTGRSLITLILMRHIIRRLRISNTHRRRRNRHNGTTNRPRRPNTSVSPKHLSNNITEATRNPPHPPNRLKPPTPATHTTVTT